MDLWGFISALLIVGAASGWDGELDAEVQQSFLGGGEGGKWWGIQGGWGALPAVPMEEDVMPISCISNLIPYSICQDKAAAAPAPLRAAAELSFAAELSSEKSLLSLFSFCSAFKAASKFLRGQILAGAARKPSQQQVRAVSVPTTQPVLL